MSRTDRKSINLALQGGGAHGAYTWGVLDALIEDSRVKIEAISGTSAGAMNAAVVADGFVRGGDQGARDRLRAFWKAVSELAKVSPVRRSALDVLLGKWNLDTSPSYLMFDLLSRVASPYELNPLNINPLRQLVEREIDFDNVTSCHDIKLHVSATNVETGRVRVFECDELSADAVLASSCLPLMFQAIEIDAVPYWDGGFMGNPVLFPFYQDSPCHDVLIVQINPIERKGTPRTAREILDRMNEITFNSSLLRELRAMDFVSRLLEEGRLDPDHYSDIRVHRIAADAELAPLGASSKMNAEWPFLEHLHDIGRRASLAWLDEHYEALGERGTVNLRQLFAGG